LRLLLSTVGSAAAATGLMLPLSQAVPDGQADVSVPAQLTYFRGPGAYSR